MSITYPLSFPLGFNFRTVKIAGINTASRNTSPFSQKEQIYIHDGDRWLVELSWPPLKEADAREIIGFLASLRGPFGTFYFRNPYSGSPRGTAGGTPLVKGGGQTGHTVITDGWPINITGVLKRGDFFNIGTAFYLITKDADSNGSGESTLDIWPALRAPADNAPLTVTNATMLCRLANNNFNYTVNTDGNYEISISAIEAV